MDSLTRSFLDARPRLLRLAHRMLGSLTDAEDVVQDAFCRLQTADTTAVDRPEAWLTRVCTNLCIDRLRVASRSEVADSDVRIPEPWVDESPDSALSLDESLSFALLVTLQRLSPNERAAFLLRDVFDESYEEIAATLDLEQAHCRQLVARGRRHVRDTGRDHAVDEAGQRQLADAFFGAIREGDIEGLRQLLADDVVLRADGGGRAAAARRPVEGAARVAQFLIAVGAGEGAAGRARLQRRFNGALGNVISEHGQVVSAFELDVRDGRIEAIWVQRDPLKLQRLQDGLGSE